MAVPWAVRGRFVFPCNGPPIRGGFVTIVGEQIVSVGARPPGGTIVDLGDVAILPGLVNPHIHLEFSLLSDPIPTAEGFASWIRRVIRYRAQLSEKERSTATRQGLQESLRGGVTTLGEIATGNWHAESYRGSEIDLTLFHELIGLTSDNADEAIQAASRLLRADAASRLEFQFGLSPHAPYTVSRSLLSRVVKLANDQTPLAMHLAESREELELLANHTGSLRDLLESVGAWSSAAFPVASRPLDYLNELSRASRSLVIHGNYLNDDEIEFLAERRNHMSVVYCPRTHAHFGHAPYPLTAMHAAGVKLAIATDGRSSNPDLNVYRDFQFASKRHPAVSPADLLPMITRHAAEALGRTNGVGLLASNGPADLAIVSVECANREDPHELLVDEYAKIVGVVRQGKTLRDDHGILSDAQNSASNSS